MGQQEQPQGEPTAQRSPEAWVLRARWDRFSNGPQEKRGQRDSLKLPEIGVEKQMDHHEVTEKKEMKVSQLWW